MIRVDERTRRGIVSHPRQGGTAIKNQGINAVGRFSVQFEIFNHIDVLDARRGLLQPGKARRLTMEGVVDSGAARLVLPESI
jgi:hypothetical protein